MTRLPAALAAFAVLATIGHASAPLRAQDPAAQPPLPSFEVAAIRRNTSGDPGMTGGLRPDGVTFTNMPVRQLIINAFGVQTFQVIGGPSWITSDRFDINAKAASGVPPAQLNLMLRSLLADRFKLVVRTEQRDLPIYTLVQAREDGKPGPNLKPAAMDCGAAGRGVPGPRGAAPGAGAPAPGGPGSLGGGCRMMIGPGRLMAGGQPIEQLARMLSTQLGRPVIDKTGLSGAFDIELSFMPEVGRGGPIGPPPPGAPPLPPIDPDAPTLVTAIQEQLGLKLEAGRGPVDVIVIDSVQAPTED